MIIDTVCAELGVTNTQDAIAEIRRLRTEIGRLREQRDQLQAANTALVERRRKAEILVEDTQRLLDVYEGRIKRDLAREILHLREQRDQLQAANTALVERRRKAEILVEDTQRLLDVYEGRIKAVRKLHLKYGIYDECGHEWREDVDWDTPEAHEGNEPIAVDEVGITCADGLLYEVCRECHTADGEPTERTDEGVYPCATLKTLGVT